MRGKTFQFFLTALSDNEIWIKRFIVFELFDIIYINIKNELKGVNNNKYQAIINEKQI